MTFGLGFAAARCRDPGLSKFVRHEMISKIPFKPPMEKSLKGRTEGNKDTGAHRKI